MQGFAVEDLASVFETLQSAGWDAVLVGGQANKGIVQRGADQQSLQICTA